jgi:uncharacterized protein YndB with AHSA1/START domain
MKKKDEPIVVEQTFDTPIDKVWKAITDPEHMRQWYFKDISSFKPEVGFETHFNVQSQERNFLHMWKIIKVDPMKKISYTWKYGGYPGDSFVEFELFKKENMTKLQLTYQVLEDFPEYIPEFKRESGLEGWQYLINESLKQYLEKV